MDALKVITKELEWSKANKDMPVKSSDYYEGFIKGLEQARDLVAKLGEES